MKMQIGDKIKIRATANIRGALLGRSGKVVTVGPYYINAQIDGMGRPCVVQLYNNEYSNEKEN